MADLLSDTQIDAVAHAMRRGAEGRPVSDEDLAKALQFVQELALSAAMLELIEEGECYLEVKDGEVLVGRMKEKLS